MELKKITRLFALSALTLTGSYGFGQFTGDVDSDFGSGGQLWYDWTGSGATSVITKLVLDENTSSFYFSGSINASGYNATVVKASLEGELDPDLVEGTINYDPFIGLDDQFESVAIQDNEKIVAAGYSIMGLGDSDIIVARFETDGTFDPTFNGGSPLTFDEGGLDFATDVVIQPDGKIVVIGSYQVAESDLDLFFLRLNSDGSPDGTFGLGGVQVLDTYFGIELIHSVTILENGNIAAVGAAGEDALVVQLDTDGNFDTGFSGDGTLNFKVNSLPSSANKLIELDGGDLLLSGNTLNEEEDGSNGFVIKMQENGMFVPDFDGDDATLLLNYETEMGLDTNFILQDMEVLPNGQILVVADYKTDTEDIGLVLINDNGEIDSEFGDNGMRMYNLSAGSLPNHNSQIEVSSTGAVYLSARVVNGEFEDIVTYRLFGDVSGLYEEDALSMEFQLYPNPTSDLLNLQVDLQEAGNLTYQVIDLAGKIIVANQLIGLPAGQNTFTITEDIADLAKGTYWLQVTHENKTATQLFIKE